MRSYSLKVVERYVGHQRTATDCGGGWSISLWEELLQAGTAEDRAELLQRLADYNREDLERMEAVYRWLLEFARRPQWAAAPH